MVTEERRVKVLDSGLAKLVEPDHPDADASTRTLQDAAPKTEEGAIVGTVAYMSPEQAEGRNWTAGRTFFLWLSAVRDEYGTAGISGRNEAIDLVGHFAGGTQASERAGAAVPRDLEKSFSAVCARTRSVASSR